MRLLRTLIRAKLLTKRLHPYQLAAAMMILVIALFLLAHPPVPKDLNYHYQVDEQTRDYPFVPAASSLVKFSVERVREVYRWNLTAETIAHNLSPLKAGDHALGMASFFILASIGAWILVFFAHGRRHVGAGILIVVVAGSLLLSNAPAYSRAVAVPSRIIPDAGIALVVRADPGHTVGVEREANQGLRDLSDRFWTEYVSFTRDRMTHAGTILPEIKRVWFGISGVAYILPFTLALTSLSALVVLLQTLAWALLVVAPFGLAVAVLDGRAGIRVREHVFLPLVLVHLALLLLSPILILVLYLATSIHAAEVQLGLLIVGSSLPIVSAYLAVRLVKQRGWARARHPRLLGAGSAGADSAQLPAPARDTVRVRVFDHRRVD